MKIAVLTVAFNERDWIAGCIDQFQGQFKQFKHLVLVSEKPWNGEWAADDTHVVALNHGAEVQVGVWASEAEQRNYGLGILKDFDWVIICDADERWTEVGISILADDLRRIGSKFSSSPIWGLRANFMEVYWKTPDYRIMPSQKDNPLVAIRPEHSFSRGRSCDIHTICTSSRLHHFSYVRSNKEMLKKIQTFTHTDEFSIMDWYADKWAMWTPEMEDLHPVVPSQFKKAVFHPCPEELRKYLP